MQYLRRRGPPRGRPPPPPPLPLPLPLRRHLYTVTEYATPSSRFPRDPGLDHVILRERNLKPLINLKNLLKSDPSNSLPLPRINSLRRSLLLPSRPIDFIRRFPLVFEEYKPEDDDGVHPHVRLSKEALDLDAEEGLVYESVEYKQDVADRLVRFLMIGRRNGVRLSVLRELKWELGLPDRFEEVLVPDFPDYFSVKRGFSRDRDVLEVVCWIDELAVSAMEMVWLANKVAKGEGQGREGGKGKKVSLKGGKAKTENQGKKEEKVQAFQFPLNFSTGFVMDEEYKEWLDEWQELPCGSPYEAEKERVVMSEKFDKGAVAMLHEILNLFVGMKGEKEIVLCIGESLEMRGRFRKALLQHPGIFYVSSKNKMYTVMLKDSYKRGALIKKNPLLEMRLKYLNLMQNKKEGDKEADPQQKKKPRHKDRREDQESYLSNESDESDEEEDEKVSGLPNKEGDSKEDDENEEGDSEAVDENKEGDSEEDDGNEEGDSEEDDEQGGYSDDKANRRGRFSNETKFSEKRISRGVGRSSARVISSEAMGERSPRSNRKIGYKGENLYPRFNRNNDYKGENSSPRFNRKIDYKGEKSSSWSNRKNDYKGEKSSSWSNRKNDYKGENSSTRSRGSSYVARQGRGAERENNMSGERKFNRQQRGTERENNMSGEKQFKCQRRGADRENNISGERPSNLQRGGGKIENKRQFKRQFDRQQKQPL